MNPTLNPPEPPTLHETGCLLLASSGFCIRLHEDGSASLVDGIEDIEDRIETIVIAVAVMIAFIAFGYIVWAEATADTIILRDDGRSYVCEVSRISQAPHGCKLITNNLLDRKE